MKKIISLFQRNYEGDRLVRDEVVPGAEWVIQGEGIAYRKWDGTACMIKDGVLYRRYDAKHGKTPPPGAIPCDPEPNAHTGHWPHWVAVSMAKADRWHRDGFANTNTPWEDGTYELCGPKVQANPEGFDRHILIRHTHAPLSPCPRDFEGLRIYLSVRNIEGIVWHHPDGRMVKIKKKDFGLKR